MRAYDAIKAMKPKSFLHDTYRDGGHRFRDQKVFALLINGLNAASGERPLRAMINRLMSRASFSVKPAPHMGMAVELYTNGTSPAKALDYCVHLQLKALLGDSSITPAPATVFDAINQAMQKIARR